jgi:hypothetical protein
VIDKLLYRLNILSFTFYNQLRHIDKKTWLVICAVLIGIVLIFISAYDSRYALRNPDGFSYISIAQNYVGGNYQVAVNAYWSPMLSWLMVPFISFGFAGEDSFMIVNAIAASFVLAATGFTVWRVTKRNVFATLLSLVSLQIFLMRIIEEYTPDTLVVAWVILFIMVLFYVDKRLVTASTRSTIMMSGALGLVAVIGYFTKIYTVPVFVVVGTVWFGMYSMSSRRSKGNIGKNSIVRQLIVPAGVLVTVIIVASPWVYALSMKYGEFMVNSSTSINAQKKFSADTRVGSTSESLQSNKRLLLPQDPTPRKSADSTASQSSSKASKSIRDYAIRRFKVLPFYVNRINSINPFILPIMLAALVLVAVGIISYRRHSKIWLLSLTFVTYFSGYLLAVETTSGGGNVRYYWPLFLIALLTVSISLPKMLELLKSSRKHQIIGYAIALALPLSLVVQYGTGYGYAFSLPVSTSGNIEKASRGDILSILRPSQRTTLANIAIDAKNTNVIKRGSILASNIDRELRYVAYYTDSTAYTFSKSLSAERMEYLTDNNVDYFVQFVPQDDRLNAARNLKIGTVVKEYSDTKIACEDKRHIKPISCTVRIIDLKNL